MLNAIKILLTNKQFYLWVGGLILAGGLFLFLLDSAIMPAYTNYDEGVTVPDVTQVSLEEAQTRLTNYGLRYEITEKRSNSAYPAGYVIDQIPIPAELVKPNRKVYLTINNISQPKVEVPDVVNLSLRNAEIQLQNYGLELGTISYESSRFKNSVLRQSIPPGKVVNKGTVVDLAVSDGLGEKMVNVPDITGLRLSEAQQKLLEAGLRVGEIRFQPSKELEPNMILSYEPKKAQLVEGESLILVVSERYDVKEESESGAIRVDTTYVAEPDTTKPDTTQFRKN